MNKAVLSVNKHGNNFLVASIISQRFNADLIHAQDQPSLTSYDLIIFVAPNSGDEELPEILENYMIQLDVKNKLYVICELGNYFGFERDCFGCKKVMCRLLDRLNWTKISDVSIDSFPVLDEQSLKDWMSKLNEFFHTS